MTNGTRRIGLIGGISWGATADYYRRINLDVKRRLGGHHSADMLIRSLDLHPLLEHSDDFDALERTFEEAGCVLAAGGAEVIGVASFTGHRYSRKVKQLQPVFVDLVDAIAERMRPARYGRVATWAASYALGDAALLERLGSSSHVQLVLPPEALRSQLDDIVFGELADQTISEASLAVLQDLLAQQIRDGATALLLATTDFSPVAKLLSADLPILDATQIHSAALVDAALEESR